MNFLATIVVAIAAFAIATQETQPPAKLKQSSSTESFFIPSIFINTPPVIRFSSPDKQFAPVPVELRPYLRWDYSRLRNTHNRQYWKSIISQTGLFPVPIPCLNDCLPSIGKIALADFSSARQTELKNPIVTLPFQKYNQLPGLNEIGDKAKLWNNIQKAKTHFGPTEFSFLLDSYILPNEVGSLEKAWDTHQVWVIKPPLGTSSRGIKITTNWTEVSEIRERTVIQKFLTHPHLSNGKTTEYRVHVLVTSVLPLRLYASYHTLAKIGLAEFSLKNVSSPCGTLYGKIHMKTCEVKNETEVLQPTEEVLYRQFSTTELNKLKENFESIIIRTLLSIEPEQQQAIESKLFNSYNGYQLLSFDFFIDNGLRPWLNEVNTNPTAYLANIPHPFSTWTDALNIAGYNFPPTLPTKAKKVLQASMGDFDSRSTRSLEWLTFNEEHYNLSLSQKELRKQARFVERFLKARNPVPTDILKDLTRDDVRQLRLLADEAARCKNTVYKRIYPPNQVSLRNPYLNYIVSEKGRYYALLFNAWSELCDTKRKDELLNRLNLF
jgi:hypothetical protein